MKKTQRIVIMGPPGSGKSTQAEKLATKLKVPHLSTGDLLRHIASDGTPFGVEIKSYLDRGKIVPDELTIELILEVTKRDVYQNGYVGEGFPRTLKQAETMDSHIDTVIYVDVDDDEVVRRLLTRLTCPKCGEDYNLLTEPPQREGICDRCSTKLTRRSDDDEKVIKNRLKVYHQTTEPAIDYFRSRNKLHVIDGRPEAEKVHQAILEVIGKVK